MKKENIEYGLYVKNMHTNQYGDIMSDVNERTESVKILRRPQDALSFDSAWIIWKIQDIKKAK
jgi:hypothetical protein